MATGSILISLLMLTGSFETDTKKAERALKRLQKEAADTGKVMGAALATGAIAAAYAFDRLVKGAAEFKDLEETTGASAEDLASLAVAAETAGVSMDTLAANSIRLTKGLTGVDDESKAAGSAIAALGLNLDDFKKLDPVAQVDALTKAFAGFKDGSEKSAVATALWGKSGAEMLKVMKALEEQGGRTKILTQTQIEQADAYADAQARAGAELKLYAQAAVTQGAPALLALTNAASELIKEIIGVDRETGKLAQSTAIRDFAQDAAVAFGWLIDDIRTSIAQLQAFAATTKKEFAAIKVFVLGPLAGGADIRALDAAKKTAADAAKALRDLASAPSVADSLKSKFAASNRGLTGERADAFSDPRSTLFGSQPRDLMEKPRLNFDGATKGAKAARAAKKEVDEVAKAIMALEEELALFDQSDAFAKAFKLEGLGATTQQVEAYRANLAKLEELKTTKAIEDAIAALVQERNELGLTNEQLTINKLLLQGASEGQIQYAKSVLDATKAARDQQEAIDEGKRIFEQTRTPAEELGNEITRLNGLLQRGAIDWDTYARATFQAQDKFDATTKKAEESVDSFSKKFAENAQDILGQGLYDIANVNFKNIAKSFGDMIVRMMAEAAAADIAKSLFGDLLKGGSGKGLFGDLLSGFGSMFGGKFADGGSPPLNKVSVVGERGPELFVPRTAGTILPASATAAIRSGDTYSFNVSVSPPQNMDRRTAAQWGVEFANAATKQAARRTNPGSK